MIVQCPDCSTRYQLDPDRVPAERIRVRCANCRYVFPIDGTLAHAPADDAASAAVTPPAPAFDEPIPQDPMIESSPSPSASVPSPEPAEVPEPTPVPETSSVEEPSSEEEPVVDEPVAEESAPQEPVETSERSSMDLEIERPSPHVAPAASAPAAAPEDSSVAVAEEPATRPEVAPSDAIAEDPQRKKARRLARALVSDILVYNRETRDKALAEGNLVQALGAEIKKSWELYKERVTPEVANSNNDFREALNDILADGQKIF